MTEFDPEYTESYLIVLQKPSGVFPTEMRPGLVVSGRHFLSLVSVQKYYPFPESLDLVLRERVWTWC